MLEVNALLAAQSKSIATESRFHRRAEDSPQHSSAGLDLSAERQEKQSADHAGCEQWKQDVGHSASSGTFRRTTPTLRLAFAKRWQCTRCISQIDVALTDFAGTDRWRSCLRHRIDT
jgi:hypothetical protein